MHKGNFQAVFELLFLVISNKSCLLYNYIDIYVFIIIIYLFD